MYCHGTQMTMPNIIGAFGNGDFHELSRTGRFSCKQAKLKNQSKFWARRSLRLSSDINVPLESFTNSSGTMISLCIAVEKRLFAWV